MSKTANKEKCVVVQCHKCGHLLYLTIDDKIFNKIKKIEKTYCPRCGEEGCDNWFLKGIDNWNRIIKALKEEHSNGNKTK